MNVIQGYPIYNEANKEHFISGFKPFELKHGERMIKTAPLRVGHVVNLLSLSGEDELIAKSKDTLAPSMGIRSIYIKVQGGEREEWLEVSLNPDSFKHVLKESGDRTASFSTLIQHQVKIKKVGEFMLAGFIDIVLEYNTETGKTVAKVTKDQLQLIGPGASATGYSVKIMGWYPRMSRVSSDV